MSEGAWEGAGGEVGGKPDGGEVSREPGKDLRKRVQPTLLGTRVQTMGFSVHGLNSSRL